RTIHSHTLSSFCMVSLALIFQPVRNTLELGQVNALMFILLAVFFALYRGGRDVPAGLVLGLSIAIRLHPAMLVLYLMWRREFRTAVVALATAVAVTLLGEGSTGDLLVSSLAGLSAILIGVVNDFYTHPLLSKGLLVFIAEIKFYGLVLLYAAIVSLLFKIRRSEGLGAPARL